MITTYIFKPRPAVYLPTGKTGRQTVFLSINDARILPRRYKSKCTFQELAAAIFGALSQAYPQTVFTGSADNAAEKRIEIDVHSYDATIYAGMWHAQTKYVVTVKKGDETTRREIEQINRYFNVWGRPTAKSTLNKCFYNANLKLFGILDTLL